MEVSGEELRDVRHGCRVVLLGGIWGYILPRGMRGGFGEGVRLTIGLYTK